jgi:P27 family predicted phage terminase small subunit
MAKKTIFAAPEFLDETATNEWNRIVSILGSKLTESDLGSLTALCAAYSRLVAAQTTLQTEGQIVVSKTGWSAPHPCIGIVNSATDQIARISKEFGLTPNSRKKFKELEADATKIKRNTLIR